VLNDIDIRFASIDVNLSTLFAPVSIRLLAHDRLSNLRRGRTLDLS
jgi:hypothetical protein